MPPASGDTPSPDTPSRDTPTPGGDLPPGAVSVVIVTRDRCAELLRVLARLRALPERPPVHVVDNASSDGTAAVVERHYPDVAVERLAENRGAAGRTVGVIAARTPYVAIADDDSWWAPGALPAAARLLDRTPRLALVAARILVGPDERPDPVCDLMAASPLPPVAGVGPVVLGFLACGAVVGRSTYLEVGGFHPRYGVGGEEALLALDLAARGWSCAYAEHVVAHHHPSPVRDGAARRAREVRNDLWTRWLRRRTPAVASGTAAAVRAARTDPAARQGLSMALAGAAWVLRERRPVAASLERQLRLLEAPGRG